jgi:hypothetical protein
MPILQTFKETVLDLGRGEAKTKAKPLLVGDEDLDRSASGLDHRNNERAVVFWLLSDRALFLVVGGDPDDHAFRIPYEAITEMTLDYDDTAVFLPWYVRIAVDPDGPGEITRLDSEPRPGQPLSAPPPVALDDDERRRLARGEIIPLAAFATVSQRFRSALQRRMELAGTALTITGAEAADGGATLMRKRRTS